MLVTDFLPLQFFIPVHKVLPNCQGNAEGKIKEKVDHAVSDPSHWQPAITHFLRPFQ
jgi:hypothetical protein